MAEDKAILEKVKLGDELTPEEQKTFDTNQNGKSEPPAQAEAPEPSGIKKEEAGTTAKPESKEAESGAVPPKKTDDPAQPAEADAQAAESEKIKKELEKPEGFEDLSSFTPRERGLFFESRRQKRRAQNAELELDTFRFEQAQQRLKEKEAAKEPPASSGPTPEEIESLFEGREDDDIPTVGEIKNLFKKKAPAKAEAKEAPKEADPATRLYQQSQINLVRAQKVEANMTLK